MKPTSRLEERIDTCTASSDSQGKTIDFLLTTRRDAQAAIRFFRKALSAVHTQEPRVINVDKNAAYPAAVNALKADEQLPVTTQLRQVKYLNNRVEQDHRFLCATDQSGFRIWVIQHSTANLKRV